MLLHIQVQIFCLYEKVPGGEGELLSNCTQGMKNSLDISLT